MEGTSVAVILGLAPMVQERPVNFFLGQPKLCPVWELSLLNRLRGESRETGGAWPLWLGFFCFNDHPHELRQLRNIHGNAACLNVRAHA